jgi:hypothetical protein
MRVITYIYKISYIDLVEENPLVAVKVDSFDYLGWLVAWIL